MQWFCGMPGASVPAAEVDLRVGGAYRITMREANGTEHTVLGVYREIVPDARLVFTWAWVSTPERESLVTVRLDATADGGTLLTLEHERFADAAARNGHLSGWQALLDVMDDRIAALEL